MLDRGQLDEFGERGFLVLPRAARRAVYFRIKRAGHDPRWREFLQDPWLDYDAVRQRLG